MAQHSQPGTANQARLAAGLSACQPDSQRPCGRLPPTHTHTTHKTHTHSPACPRAQTSFGGGETMSMKQLSGGQRTLVALALIFAIQVTAPGGGEVESRAAGGEV